MCLFRDDDIRLIVADFSSKNRPSEDLKKLHALATNKNKLSRLKRDQMEKWAEVIPRQIKTQIRQKLLNPKTWYHANNELYAAYYLTRLGCEVIEINPQFNGKTPDFLMFSPDAQKFVVEILTADLPRQQRSGMSDIDRLRDKIEKKINKYKKYIPSGISFTVGVVPDFRACVLVDEFKDAFDNSFLKRHSFLAGAFFFDYQTNSEERGVHIPNPFSRASFIMEGFDRTFDTINIWT